MSGFQPCPCIGEVCAAAANPKIPAKTPTPVLMSGLAGTLSEKSRACLPLAK